MTVLQLSQFKVTTYDSPNRNHTLVQLLKHDTSVAHLS